jgi:peptidoglycan/LPS O-acetylase OafA/YrhL
MEGKKFAQLDSLRFFAVFLVVGSHYTVFSDYLLGILDPAFRGVDLFFVLSGFLITLGLLKSHQKENNPSISLRNFYIRRFLRIFPIYYLTLFFYWCFDHQYVAQSIWWNLFYLSNFYLIKVQDWSGVSHLWSLAVEEQFYLVWPLVILFVPRRWVGPTIIFSVLFSIAVKIYWQLTGVSWWVWYVHPVSSLDSLALGGLLAYLYNYHNEDLNKWIHKSYTIALTFIAVVIIIYFKQTELAPLYGITIRFFYGLFCTVLIGRAVYGFKGITGSVFNNPWLQYIGKISYAIYLFIPVPKLIERLLLNDLRLGLVVEVLIIVSLASFSWHFFEKPILKFKEGFE